MTTTTNLTPAERAYRHADRELHHLQRLLLGDGLTARQQDDARKRMVRWAGRKVRAEMRMEKEQVNV